MSIIKGIPVFCGSHTIGYEICNKDIKNINNPKLFDRTNFFNNFAHQIWSIDEIKKVLFGLSIKNI